PRVPGFVHGIPQTDVGHPDGGGYHLRLVGAAKIQETIDFILNLLGCPMASFLLSAAVIPAVNTKPLASTTLDKSFDGSWRAAAMASFSLIRDDAGYLHSTATTPRHFKKAAPYCNMPMIKTRQGTAQYRSTAKAKRTNDG